MQAQAQAQAAQAQQQVQALQQAELALKEKDINTKLATHLTTKWNELPIDAKVQALASLGIQTTPESVAANDQMLRDFELEQSKLRGGWYSR